MLPPDEGGTISTSEKIEELEAEASRLFAEMQDVLRGGQHPQPDTVMDTVEARFFIAARRLLLAQFDLPDAPDQAVFTIKAQQKDFGALLIVSFTDRLAAVDPLRWCDAVFVSNTSPLWRLMDSLKASAENRPCRGSQRLPGPSTAYEEFKWIRRTLYPEGLSLPKGKKRRAFVRQEVHDTLAALAAYKDGEPPSVELQVRDLDLDNMTPLAALEALARLQDQARRITDAKQFLPKSLGGGLSPSE